MPLRVTYARLQDLLADHETQFAHGGLLVRVESADLEQHAEVELGIASPQGSVALAATVLQVMPGTGVAVAFDAASAELARLVEKARSAGSSEGEAPVHEIVESLAAAEESPRKQIENVFERVKKASMPEKIQMALHGQKGERAAIIRDTNKTLHQYVIRNPHIQTDEVVAIARMTTVAPDVLRFIGERREWYQRPEIASAMVRNPKTPVPMAIRLLAHVSGAELRQIAKGNNVKMQVAGAARKRLLR